MSDLYRLRNGVIVEKIEGLCLHINRDKYYPGNGWYRVVRVPEDVDDSEMVDDEGRICIQTNGSSDPWDHTGGHGGSDWDVVDSADDEERTSSTLSKSSSEPLSKRENRKRLSNDEERRVNSALSKREIQERADYDALRVPANHSRKRESKFEQSVRDGVSKFEQSLRDEVAKIEERRAARKREDEAS